MTPKQQLMQGYTKPVTVPAIVRVYVEPGRPVVQVNDARGWVTVVATVEQLEQAPEVGR